MLGSGKRLFGRTSGKKSLTLTDSKTVGDGVTILIYRPTASVTAVEPIAVHSADDVLVASPADRLGLERREPGFPQVETDWFADPAGGDPC